MSFPPYGTAVPSLLPYQFQFNEFSFGPYTPLELTKIEGIDLPAIRSGDSGRPRDQGEFIGLDLMAGREVTVTGELNIKTESSWEELASATLPGGTVEKPLFLSLPGYPILAAMSRVRKRNMPVDIKFTLGNLADVTLLFKASDPRWYGETKRATTSPSHALGFKWPHKYGYKYGAGSVAGSVSVTNAGNYETRPKLIVEGPCTNPSITNATVGATLAFAVTLNTGDRLVIDTDMHTATLYSSGTTVGTTRLGSLVPGSQWWALEAKTTSTVQFLAGSSEGSLTVEYAPAYVL
jgi:Phage tail protein